MELSPTSFKQLPKDGYRFESLVCQLLEGEGYSILERPAVGPDGGSDILVERRLKDMMCERRERVLIQCKHKGHSGDSVKDRDLEGWQNAMTRKDATGYLLVTSTRLAVKVRDAFSAFSKQHTDKWAAFWEVDFLIALLNKHSTIRDSFFPPVRRQPSAFVNEVCAWLIALKYTLSSQRAVDGRTSEFVATLQKGTVLQRILVRCVAGEVQSDDIMNLHSALNQMTQQGWLIGDMRVAPSAKEAVGHAPNCSVFTLSSFLRDKVWAPYCEWFSEVIENCKLRDLYINVGCYKQRIDDHGKEVGRDTYDNIEDYIDLWLKDASKNHISILGPFGSGKTWFCRHFAHRQLERYFADPINERLPLLLPLRHFTTLGENAQGLINDALVEQFKLPLVGSAFDVFKVLNEQGKLLLILDGFDEMSRKVDKQKVVDNFWALADLVVDQSKVILTSRTEYFSWAKESEEVLRGHSTASAHRPLAAPTFEIVHMQPFTESQIREVIKRRVGKGADGDQLADKILAKEHLRELLVKPVLIELVLTAIEEVHPDMMETMSEVYLYATSRIIRRNVRRDRTFTKTADKLYFLCHLATDMLETGNLRIHYRELPDKIRDYFGTRIKDQHELDIWRYDLQTQTLLHRDAAGYYEFAHKSMAEYFCAYKLAAERGLLGEIYRSEYREVDDSPYDASVLNQSFSPDIKGLPPTTNSTVATFFVEMISQSIDRFASVNSDNSWARMFREINASRVPDVNLCNIVDHLVEQHIAGYTFAKGASIILAFGRGEAVSIIIKGGGSDGQYESFDIRFRKEVMGQVSERILGELRIHVNDVDKKAPMYEEFCNQSEKLGSHLARLLIAASRVKEVWEQTEADLLIVRGLIL